MQQQRQLTYLNINEQQEILNKLGVVTDNAPYKEKFFYLHGSLVSAVTLLASSLVFWRSGFRAYNLHKYSRGRISTLGLTCTSCINGALAHNMFVRGGLTDFYRSENKYNYAIKSLAVHQFGLLSGFLYGSGITFLVAQRIGIIPVPDRFTRKGNRQIAINYFTSKLKPYSKTIAITCLMSSAVMFMVGLVEFEQSRDLLAKINRKTLIVREDC